MPSRRSNGCADALILFATFLEPYHRRSYCTVMPYLLDERSSTRLGSVKNVFRTKFFPAHKQKDTGRPGFVATFFGLTPPAAPTRAVCAPTHPQPLPGGELLRRGRTSAPLLGGRSEEHTSELQSLAYLVCRLLL